MRFRVNHCLPLAALILMGEGSTAFAADRRQPPPDAPVSGPAADYPVVVGAPFTIDGKVWTPIDQLNYDAVGLALTGTGAGVTAAHKTLPLPSYAEVTALDTGHTILVRMERRGPMTNDALVELSPEAATQLGLAPGARGPVRVRRVNPPEQERAMLRGGGRAPERMETPEGLLKVLRRKLTDQSPLTPSLPASVPAGTVATLPRKPAAQAAVPKPSALKPPMTDKPRVSAAPKTEGAAQKPSAAPTPRPVPARALATPRASTVSGSIVVQVAAFSSETAARTVAGKLGGTVSRAGKFWRVRLGGYPNRAQAAAALEKARRAGYSDARIQRAD